MDPTIIQDGYNCFLTLDIVWDTCVGGWVSGWGGEEHISGLTSRPLCFRKILMAHHRDSGTCPPSRSFQFSLHRLLNRLEGSGRDENFLKIQGPSASSPSKTHVKKVGGVGGCPVSSVQCPVSSGCVAGWVRGVQSVCMDCRSHNNTKANVVEPFLSQLNVFVTYSGLA